LTSQETGYVVQTGTNGDDIWGYSHGGEYSDVVFGDVTLCNLVVRCHH